MRNNKGFSLIEMIVVVAIIAILAGGAVVGFSYLQGRGAESTAQKIAALLKESQAISTSKYENSFIIQIDQEGQIIVTQTYKATIDSEPASTVTNIGDTLVSLSYETSANLVTLTTGSSLTLSFDRTDGTFEYIEGSEDYCYKIYVDKGGTRKTISLTPKTGKITVE